MEIINRKAIADLIYKKLVTQKPILKNQFEVSKNGIGYFFVDDLLPHDLVIQIQEFFPKFSDQTPKYLISNDINLLFYNGQAIIGHAAEEMLLIKKKLRSVPRSYSALKNMKLL